MKGCRGGDRFAVPREGFLCTPSENAPTFGFVQDIAIKQQNTTLKYECASGVVAPTIPGTIPITVTVIGDGCE